MNEAKLLQNQNSKTWPHHASPLTNVSLDAIFKNEIPAVILPGLVSTKDCDRIVENLKQLGMGTYGHVSHPVGRFGLAQMEYHIKGTKQGYFDKVPEATNSYAQAIHGADDPVKKLIGYLAHATSAEVGIAREANFGSMFAGTFRNVMSLGHKHFDFAPFEAQGWEIAKLEGQLSWNLYLNQPVGGDLVVYDRLYSPSDEKFRVDGQYYYDDAIVSGRQEFRYTPRVGDVVIFNSRNIHEVEPVNGDRFSLSSFIGRLKDQSLLLWS